MRRPTINRLGVLWTWDFQLRSYQPIYTVLAAEEVHETAAMMPQWEPNTANHNLIGASNVGSSGTGF